MEETQKLLTPDQLEAFYHDNFVKSQVTDFIALTRSLLNPSSKVIVDIGGEWAISQKLFRSSRSLPVLDSLLTERHETLKNRVSELSSRYPCI